MKILHIVASNLTGLSEDSFPSFNKLIGLKEFFILVVQWKDVVLRSPSRCHFTLYFSLQNSPPCQEQEKAYLKLSILT